MKSGHPHNALNCKEVFALLSEYIDGELTAEACREVEDHIRDCPPCVKFLDSLKKSLSLVRQHAPEIRPATPPPELRDALLAVYRRKLEARRSG